MKQLFINLLMLCQAYTLYAGDDICSASFLDSSQDLPIIFDNIGNTNSGVPAPPFGGYAGPDSWFEFSMPGSGEVYLLLEGLGMENPAIAVYQGPCTDPTLLYNVLDNNCDGSSSPQILIDDLDPGTTYYIRIWPENGSVNGDFAINLTQNLPTLPSFDVFADAYVDNDCIQLTTEAMGLQGCAWYQIPIDFTEDFTHTMTANFGDIDANGADGICLVYQTNGPSFCGGTGGGIGAEGMPNSAIFEFDTWQNGQFVDPFLDHASFNVNGNMNHANSISGPVTLGNIEDGLDHIITLEWLAGSNSYSLYFDNVLLFTGSYDIVNNCFGGNSTAYWGYTSATGGSFNNQVICPEVEDYSPSTVSYEAVVICDGDTYNGYASAGFYVETTAGANGCLHQHHIDLSLAPDYDDQYVDTIICAGDQLVLDGVDYSTPNIYNIYALSEYGCDSNVVLEVMVLDGEVLIADPDTLDCATAEVVLTATATSNFNTASIEYDWPSVFGAGTNEITVYQSGTYGVNVSFTVGDLTCIATDQTIVAANILVPNIQELADVNISCESTAVSQLVNSGETAGLLYTWQYDNVVISNAESVSIVGEGTYIFTAVDPENSCEVSDTVLVEIDDELPTVEVVGQQLNCQVHSFVPEVTVSADVEAYRWTDSNGLLSESEELEIASSGTYTLEVTNASGCTATEVLVVELDTLVPQVAVPDAVIGCDEPSVTVVHMIDTLLAIDLSGPEDIAAETPYWQISEAGHYIIKITDPDNLCESTDTFMITDLGASPVLTAAGGVLTCEDATVALSVEADLADVDIVWQSDVDILGSGYLVDVTEPGKYQVAVTSATGCTSVDSVEVTIDTLRPEYMFTTDSLSCTHTVASLSVVTDTDYDVQWFDPFGSLLFTGDTLNTSSAGQYVVRVINPVNGCSAGQTVDVVSYAVDPDYTIAGDTLTCLDSIVVLDFFIDFEYLEVQWTGPSGFTSSELNPSVTESGQYSISMQLTDDCLLDTVLSIGLDVEPPALTYSADTITCAEPFAEIILDYDPETYIDLSNEQGPIAASTIVSTDVPGTYLASLEGANGCTADYQWEVIAYTDEPAIAAMADGNVTCADTEVILTATSDAGNVQYSWEGPNGSLDGVSQIEVYQGGVYTVEVVDQYGCSASSTIEISENTDIPSLELFGDDLDCNTTRTVLEYVSNGEDLVVVWLDTDGNTIDKTVTNAGTYYCQITDAYGCSNEASVEILSFTDSPEIYSIGGEVIEIDADNADVQLEIEVISDYTYDLFWTPAEVLSCADCLDPKLLSFEEESINVLAVNEYGCTDELTINFIYKRREVVKLPNIFSPNGDGRNDFFTVYGNEQIASVRRFDIYDRWGGLVWQKGGFVPNIDEEGWDGTYNGRPAMEGVYVYVTEVITVDGEALVFVGDVTVLR